MAANPVRVAAAAALVGAAAAYDNGSRSRLPPMGWSSWVALGPGAQPPQFDFCDEFSVTQSIEALMALGLPQLGYTHVHLDDCCEIRRRREMMGGGGGRGRKWGV